MYGNNGASAPAAMDLRKGPISPIQVEKAPQREAGRATLTLGELEAQISALEQNAARLAHRLDPILAPTAPPGGSGGGPSTPQPITSGLTAVLATLAGRVGSVREVLISLTDRLEL